MFKALIAGLLSANGVSAVALTSESEWAYESVPWDFHYDDNGWGQSRALTHELPEPAAPAKTDFSDWTKKLWRPYTGKYDFPGRTDWGEDPDHFNFNNGGFASHRQYNKPLDFSTVIRPWRTERKHRHGASKKEEEHNAPLEHVFEEEFDDFVPEFAGPGKRKKNVGGHALGNFNPRASRPRRGDPIPDAYDYSGLRWSTKKGLNKLSHHGHDLPKLKKNGFSKFSYLKSADDFGSEDCIGCEFEDHDHHPLDKEDNTKLGNLDEEFLGFSLRRPNYPDHADDNHAEEEERLSIDPTLDNRDLVRHYNPWVEWNPEPVEVKEHHHVDVHPLDKIDNTKLGNVDSDLLGFDLRRKNYPTAEQQKSFRALSPADQRARADRTVFPKTFEADEFAPLGRWIQQGNTDPTKFYNNELHHSYEHRQPLHASHPEILAAADWARHVR